LIITNENEAEEAIMYSWGDSMEDWARPDAYRFDEARSAARAADAAAAAARGGRTYQRRRAPDEALTDPRKKLASGSATPLVIAVDVTGSMQTWPAEIFDRLPLLYQTLSQYRPELEIAFAAIGDATCDRYPLQITDFAKGIELEDRLKALYGEGGGGGGARESYELFAAALLHNVATPAAAERPIVILYGDEGFYPEVDARQAQHYLGLPGVARSAHTVWQRVVEKFDLYHLRKPYGDRKLDRKILEQWTAAIGEQRIVGLEDPFRAVDYALGLISRKWGRFEDFKTNMRARQDDAKVDALANSVLAVEPIPPTRRSA
jgi:hypothetical protein